MACTLRLSKSHSAGQGQVGRQGDRLHDGITDRDSSVRSTLIPLKLRQLQEQQNLLGIMFLLC